MDSPSNPVIVDRDFFHDLQRRAGRNSQATSANSGWPSFEPTVHISKHEYDGLRQTAQKYTNLRQNLLEGGLQEDLLHSHGHQNDPATDTDKSWGNGPAGEPLPSQGVELQPPQSQGYAPSRQRSSSVSSDEHSFHSLHSYTAARDTNQGNFQTASAGIDSTDPYGVGGGEYHVPRTTHVNDGIQTQDQGSARSSSGSRGADLQNNQGNVPGPLTALDRHCQRTIQLVGLPEGTTIADVASVVQGGPLLELYSRSHDHSVSVSFVRGTDAKGFFDHVKRHGLYIRNKRVDVRWSERQFVLTGYVANKVSTGVTRNLLIRSCGAQVTEKTIREDLEHIHNLVVISVAFADGDCYISTNSIHNALFARSCMMSRVTYKGLKIEWWPDGCDQPIQHAAPPRPTQAMPVARRPPGFAGPNRFQVLRLDSDGS